MSDITTDERADWERFLALLGAGIQGLPDDVRRETPLRQLEGTDNLRAGQLRARLEELLDDPPAELLDAVATAGDAHDWWVARGRHAGAPAPAADGADRPPSFRARSTRCELVPLAPHHLEVLYATMRHPEIGFRWRLGGVSPTPEQMLSSLQDSTFVNYSVVRPDGELVGLVAGYNPHYTDGTFHFGLLRAGTDHPVSEMLGGLFLFLDYCFFNWAFRKAYAEIPGFNWHLFASGEGTLFEVEGVLREHEFLDGRYWDQRIITVSRDRWGDIKRTWSRFLPPVP